MAVLKKNYKDINDTLKHIRLQIEESLPFTLSYCPKFKDPYTLFLWLKPQLKYRKDPSDTELLQSFPTMMRRNFYGIPGTGDCDCFSIGAVSCCLIQNWNNCKIWIKLAGRNKFCPVHIWSGVTINGKDYPLDFTNRLPGVERDYPYIQKIEVKKLKRN
jgi:hypothetical protein